MNNLAGVNLPAACLKVKKSVVKKTSINYSIIILVNI